ncbi:aminodeoxychorismate synthase component I [Thalassobacillus sp. CUG 92003]|uniref:aminodeoxychorismate synthase component I n=1 Tax=Thalassobacillus sp. CUG 92003 TaxID=2736641 RepID=UPI0015E7ABCA|nr:aminodeoxychorismate synthase component I [Thalassobacillus sp. CUG 92003]
MTAQPWMLFEFNEVGETSPLLFENPIKTIIAQDLPEVAPAFNEAQRALNDGYYVAGYVSYEAAPAFDPAYRVHRQPNLPLVWFGVFAGPVQESVRREGDYHLSKWLETSDYDTYQNGIDTIKQAIEEGETYQVNYTTRLTAKATGDPYSFYRQLTRNQQAPYSAFLDLGETQLLSASPELFFRKKGNKLTTKPMKGTSRRGRFTAEDDRAADALYYSEKDRAENVMIVDLLRNDVGRLAVPGSVRVPKLFDIEKYPTVHQMTSTVEGTLPEKTNIYDIFKALFPCGSITGAPKIRTMEYIAALEPEPRDVYCGAIGYMTPAQDATFNVAIRTVTMDQARKRAVYGTGGGVTWDSTSEGEFAEMKTKARLLTESRTDFQLLETMKLEEGTIFLLKRHVQRLLDSARYFGFALHIEVLKHRLQQVVLSHLNGVHKLRLLLSKDGSIEIETTRLNAGLSSVVCTLAAEPVNEQDPFLFHKTTHRDIYNQHAIKAGDSYAVLLFNTKGELTEFTTGNVVVEEGGHYFTPPIESGLLAGTFRNELVERGKVREKVIYKHELASFERVWFVNGVREWVLVLMRD